jgi:protein-S-isoprenylcysteine O-methyltransferase Ste14
MLALRSVFFTLVVPGTVVGLVPYLIVGGWTDIATRSWGAAEAVSLVPIATGTAILIWCIRDFAVAGRGTLAPVDPPKHLVQRGLYRHVRNPMYLGALVTLLGESMLFRSAALLTYTAAWFAFVNVFVLLFEEPALLRSFGAPYEAYCQSVRRWIPRIRPVM